MGGSVSSFAGGASMIAWLFAQLPQIVKNYQQGSVESLAPTFLLSWMAGDATNLLGCILTDQLVFQTYLATYFCCIDVILIAQYVHYSRINPGPTLPEEPKHSSSRFLRRHLVRTNSSDMASADPMSQSFLSTGRSQSRVRYSRKNSDSQPKHKPSLSRSNSRPPASTERSMLNSVASLASSNFEDSPEMTSSVISLPRGRTRSAPRGSRGAQASRDGASPSRQRSMIFLGLFAFIGFGTRSQWNPSTSISPDFTSPPTTAWDLSLTASRESDVPSSIQPPSPILSFEQFHNKPDEPHDSPPNAHTPEDVQRIIGRSSAWICAALYLTSRMPQVWKNYRRRSVEGLSILLFMAAFVGNLTYTISILTNPFTKTDPKFLVDALPYLIGSGGTLIFDLTIMSQSLLYRNQHPRLAHSHSKKRSRSRVHADEEGLLSSETDDEDRGREPRKEGRHKSSSIPHATEVERSSSLTISPTSRERNRSIGRSLDMYNAEQRVLEAGPIDEVAEPRSVH